MNIWEQYLELISIKMTHLHILLVQQLFKNLSGDFQILVVGTAAEIQNIITTYGTSISNLPSAVTFDVTDGNALTLTQAQLDVLDARIEGVVQISDDSSGIASLLNNAIPTSVQSITSLTH